MKLPTAKNIRIDSYSSGLSRIVNSNNLIKLSQNETPLGPCSEVSKIIKKNLSVRQAEALARLVKSNKSSIKSKDPNSIDIENQLSSKIGMKVFLNNKKNNTGTLIFEYKGVDQLDRLIKIIKENY